MTPLRIIAEMAEPIVYSGDGMHLDGPLAWAYWQRMPRDEREALPPVTEEPLDFPLPLARWQHGDWWGWCCSAVHAVWDTQSTHHVRRRTAIREMARYTTDGTVQIGAGPFKPANKPFPTRFARRLTWYAVGDQAGVRELLEELHGIGKLCNHGAGRVLRWSVTRLEHDWSVMRDGKPTRRLPDGFDGLVGTRVGAIRPPYHHRARHTLCVEPVFDELVP